METPATLTDMKELHSELKSASTEFWELRKLGKMSDAGYEVAQQLLFDERQDVFSAASRKVATTVEELAAQLDILVLEADDDPICIHAGNDHYGKMMRSIRAGVSSLSAYQDAPALKAINAG